MSIDPPLLSRVEGLRIPLDDIDSPIDWKDWYHYILIDPETQIRVLVNVSLMGRPEQGELQTTIMVSLPTSDAPQPLLQAIPTNVPVATFGVAFSQPWTVDTVQRHPLRIQGKTVSLTIQDDVCLVEAADRRSQLSVQFLGQAKATPLFVTDDSPFGSGFIGWGLIPGLRVSGELSVCQQTFTIDQNWFCYHDHNFGRFRWGEDIGWEWFVAFLTDKNGRTFTLVLDKRTNKDHTITGLPYIFIYEGPNLVKTLLGDGLSIDWQWTPRPVKPLRLPGIMASFFSEQALKMPQRLDITATDDQAHLTLSIDFDAAAELIIPDNQARQYSFIEEVTGPVQMTLSLQGDTIEATGVIYAEYVI